MNTNKNSKSTKECKVKMNKIKQILSSKDFWEIAHLDTDAAWEKQKKAFSKAGYKFAPQKKHKYVFDFFLSAFMKYLAVFAAGGAVETWSRHDNNGTMTWLTFTIIFATCSVASKYLERKYGSEVTA